MLGRKMQNNQRSVQKAHAVHEGDSPCYRNCGDHVSAKSSKSEKCELFLQGELTGAPWRR
jgi:hypothetical protein